MAVAMPIFYQKRDEHSSNQFAPENGIFFVDLPPVVQYAVPTMCGFVGIIGPADCASSILFALQALQHRGQDSAGIGTIQKEEFLIVRKLGLAAQGFGAAELALLPGRIGIGHVRYPTIGSGILRDTQPFFYRQPGILMAHNGNFINIQEMIDSLTEE